MPGCYEDCIPLSMLVPSLFAFGARLVPPGNGFVDPTR